MEAVFEEPVGIYLCLVLASVAILIEAALPTFGLAGALGLFLAVVGSVAIADQQLEWWPLILAAAGVGVWGVSLVFKRKSPTGQIVAFALFTSGSLLFALLAEDTPTTFVAIATALGLAWAHPRLFGVTHKLMHATSEVGMESFVGKPATVIEWEGDTGRVKLGGGYWAATGDSDLVVGQQVTVLGYEGMHLTVGTQAGKPQVDKQGDQQPWKQ